MNRVTRGGVNVSLEEALLWDGGRMSHWRGLGLVSWYTAIKTPAIMTRCYQYGPAAMRSAVRTGCHDGRRQIDDDRKLKSNFIKRHVCL